jgi:hypothetical protein
MAKKKVAEFVECMRFQRCDAVGCDVREWHRHEVTQAEGLRVFGASELLEEKLDPPTEPEPQPPPSLPDPTPPEFED